MKKLALFNIAWSILWIGIVIGSIGQKRDAFICGWGMVGMLIILFWPSLLLVAEILYFEGRHE